MKNVFLALALVLAVGCGRRVGPAGPQGATGSSGSDGLTSLVSLVNAAPTCLTGVITVVSGLDTDRSGTLDANEVTSSQVVCNGATGNDGNNGGDGHNSLVAVVHSASGCAAGGITLLAGVDADDSGSLSPSEVASSGEVCNGNNGLNGINGTNGTDAPPTAFTPVGLIDPCGDAPGVFDEIFVKLQNGTLIASFSDNASGANTRFSVLVTGTNYRTTDGSSCYFSVNAAGVYNDHY